MSYINITWHYRDNFLVIYDSQSGITIGDALNEEDLDSFFLVELLVTINVLDHSGLGYSQTV
jgi:hypothetical protein